MQGESIVSSATPVVCQVCGVSYAGADKSRCPNCGIETGGREPDRFAGRIEKCYKFIERIGEGGMGVVYRGEQIILKKTVALKLTAGTLSEEETGRLLREAQLAARVEHPNVVQVFDADVVDGRLFIVTQFVAGRSLEKVIEAERLSPIECARIVRAAASGLAAIHEKGIIHRDIKPSNILITDKGEVKISDFGISKEFGKITTRLTSEGFAVGTPAYMSPEQCRGEPLTTATDLYSLGIVFYELLTGSHPYPADDSWALMNKHTGEELPPLTDDVPRPLARIVEEMTRKSADERSLSAAEIAEELDDFIKGNRNKGMRKRAMLFIVGEIVILAAILALVAAVSYAIGARHS